MTDLSHLSDEAREKVHTGIANLEWLASNKMVGPAVNSDALDGIEAIAALLAEVERLNKNIAGKQKAFAAFQSNLPQVIWETLDKAFDEFNWNALIGEVLARYDAEVKP